MTYIEKTDIHSTLTTWIYCAYWQAWAAEQTGRTPYINWPKGKSLIDLKDDAKFAECPNMYEWYFVQESRCSKCRGVGCIECTDRDILLYNAGLRDAGVKLETDNIETWTWEQWQDPTPVALMAQPLDVIKEYYQKKLVFNSAVEWRGLELKNKYNIDFSKTIGVTWRGTDIYLESQNGFAGRTYTPIERYFKWIDRALEEIPDARIMCTAEESGILEPLLKRYPQAFVIEEFYQAPKGGKHNPERFSPLSGYERGMQPVLMLWLFSKCAWYVKNRASTSGIAGWLSKGNVVSIEHPANLGFPVNIPGDEFNGQIFNP